MTKLFNIKMKLLNVPQLQRSLKNYSDSLEKHFERGITKAGAWLLRESKKIVPVDTNALRTSGIATKQHGGWRTTIIISYSTSYAIYVHEDLNARHAKGKSAKFLEKPFRTGLATMRKIIQDECKKAKFK